MADRTALTLRYWREELFPLLRAARAEWLASGAEFEAAREELQAGEEAVEQHDYTRLLAAREAARKCLAKPEQRRADAYDPDQFFAGPYRYAPDAIRLDFDQEREKRGRE